METVIKKGGRPKRIHIPDDDAPIGTISPADVTAALMRQANALINLKIVCQMTSLSPRQISRMVPEGRFPKPKMIGAMRKAWHISDVEKWIQQPVI